MCHQQGGNESYETSISQEKQDTQNGDHASFTHPISLKVKTLSFALFSCFSFLKIIIIDLFFYNYKLICKELSPIPVFGESLYSELLTGSHVGLVEMVFLCSGLDR